MNENVVDFILFGSFVKGGSANDIDIAVVVKENKELTNIKKKINSIINKADIQVITIESLHSPMWLTLIKEGYSIKKKKFLFELYNITPVVLYKYSLKKLSNVQKVQFERGIKNVLGNKGTFLTRSVVIIPIDMKDDMSDFLKTWDILYESHEYELLPVLRKETFL